MRSERHAGAYEPAGSIGSGRPSPDIRSGKTDVPLSAQGGPAEPQGVQSRAEQTRTDPEPTRAGAGGFVRPENGQKLAKSPQFLQGDEGDW